MRMGIAIFLIAWLASRFRSLPTAPPPQMKMKMPAGDWEPFAFRLNSKRDIEFEKLSPPQYSGVIHARTAQALDIKEEKREGSSKTDK